jgi:hypothetical protein
MTFMYSKLKYHLPLLVPKDYSYSDMGPSYSYVSLTTYVSLRNYNIYMYSYVCINMYNIIERLYKVNP